MRFFRNAEGISHEDCLLGKDTSGMLLHNKRFFFLILERAWRIREGRMGICPNFYGQIPPQRKEDWFRQASAMAPKDGCKGRKGSQSVHASCVSSRAWRRGEIYSYGSAIIFFIDCKDQNTKKAWPINWVANQSRGKIHKGLMKIKECVKRRKAPREACNK